MQRYFRGGKHVLSSQGIYSLVGKPEMWKYIDLRILRKRVSKQVPFNAQIRSL